MIHLNPLADKRSIDRIVGELIAQGFGRGEIAAHMRRVAHRLLRPVRAKRLAADFCQKCAKSE